MGKKFYITTAIDYPSGPPHIGHVYEKVCADLIARWHRGIGDDVFFSTGTDEHGQKIQRYALQSNQSPEVFVNEMSKKFMDLWAKINISYDSFIRTTQARHERVVRQFLKKLYEKGDIYEGEYEGLYCVDCEAFYTEKELQEGLCPVHNKKAEKIKEKSYFFSMSKYQARILEYIENNQDFIQPQARKNEVINRIKEGIRDLSISRSSFDWGIKFPIQEKHVIFVWIDALINYISVLGYPGEEFRKYWPADIHLIGKDIIWFHAVVWPALLMAADLELPKKIFVHGFINIKGEKISKSKGAPFDLPGLIDKYGSDALRYFLLREIRFGEDGDFSEVALIKRINGDLANDLGNLVYRTLTMIEKYFAGKIPKAKLIFADSRAKEIEAKIKSLDSEIMANLGGSGDYNFSASLERIWELINMANKYVEDTKPWNLSKENKTEELEQFILVLVEVIRKVQHAIYPFMPETAEAIKEQLGEDKINKGKPLFPRIESL